jgi:hypothetical protein
MNLRLMLRILHLSKTRAWHLLMHGLHLLWIRLHMRMLQRPRTTTSCKKLLLRLLLQLLWLQLLLLLLQLLLRLLQVRRLLMHLRHRRLRSWSTLHGRRPWQRATIRLWTHTAGSHTTLASSGIGYLPTRWSRKTHALVWWLPQRRAI